MISVVEILTVEVVVEEVRLVEVGVVEVEVIIMVTEEAIMEIIHVPKQKPKEKHYKNKPLHEKQIQMLLIFVVVNKRLLLLVAVLLLVDQNQIGEEIILKITSTRY